MKKIVVFDGVRVKLQKFLNIFVQLLYFSGDNTVFYMYFTLQSYWDDYIKDKRV